MSTVVQTDKARFQEIMGDARRWASIDRLLEACDEAEFWKEDFLDKVTERAKKAQIRRLIKQLHDSEGFPLWANIETKNEEGETIQVYKQELLFDPDDYRQVVAYHGDRAKYHGRMARTYAKRCDKRFKTRLHRQLTLEFDGESSADPKRPR